MIKRLLYYIKRFFDETKYPRTKYFIFIKSLIKLNKKSNKTSDKLYAIYDLSVNPVTFDFLEFLICADMHRAAFNFKSIEVYIIAGFYKGLRKENEDYEKVINYNKRIWRIYNILIPCTTFFKSITGISLKFDRNDIYKLLEDQFTNNIYPNNYNPNLPKRHNDGIWLDYYKIINKVPLLESLKSSQRYVDDWLKTNIKNKKIITITLRMYDFRVKRNSNLNAWLKFAKAVDNKKYAVVFIPDTESVMSLDKSIFKDFYLFTEACWNLNLRLSIMEKSYLNFFISGITHLCTFTKNPYIYIKCLTEEYFSEEFEKKNGYIKNKKPDYALDDQYWVWEDDTYENIMKSFINFEKKHE